MFVSCVFMFFLVSTLVEVLGVQQLGSSLNNSMPDAQGAGSPIGEDAVSDRFCIPFSRREFRPCLG